MFGIRVYVEDKSLVSLKEYFEKLREADLKAIEATIGRVEETNEKRFQAQDTAVRTAFDASKEAIIKSEIGVEKRSDAVYVTITKLQDSLTAVMPRSEAEQRFSALSEKIDLLKADSDTGAGKTSGMDKSWMILLGAVGGLATIVGLILAFSS